MYSLPQRISSNLFICVCSKMWLHISISRPWDKTQWNPVITFSNHMIYPTYWSSDWFLRCKSTIKIVQCAKQILMWQVSTLGHIVEVHLLVYRLHILCAYPLYSNKSLFQHHSWCNHIQETKSHSNIYNPLINNKINCCLSIVFDSLMSTLIDTVFLMSVVHG